MAAQQNVQAAPAFIQLLQAIKDNGVIGVLIGWLGGLGKEFLVHRRKADAARLERLDEAIAAISLFGTTMYSSLNAKRSDDVRNFRTQLRIQWSAVEIQANKLAVHRDVGHTFVAALRECAATATKYMGQFDRAEFFPNSESITNLPDLMKTVVSFHRQKNEMLMSAAPKKLTDFLAKKRSAPDKEE